MSFTFPPEAASDLDPLFVTSPTIRSGTTLLQRLLCSSSNALVYGEECGKDLGLVLQLYASRVAFYTHSRQRFSTSLRRVLDGDVDDWITDLMPDPEGYVRALGRAYLSGLAYCRDHAARVGRPVWGVKYPGWPPNFINTLRLVMPRSRFIIIRRDLADSLRSAKARRSVNSEQESRQFCENWKTNLAFALGLRGDPSALLLDYAELVGEPSKVIDAVAAFAGIRGMRADTLDRKINTWVEGAGPTALQTGYIEPAALTDAEQRMADEAASAVESLAPGV